MQRSISVRPSVFSAPSGNKIRFLRHESKEVYQRLQSESKGSHFSLFISLLALLAQEAYIHADISFAVAILFQIMDNTFKGDCVDKIKNIIFVSSDLKMRSDLDFLHLKLKEPALTFKVHSDVSFSSSPVRVSNSDT